MKRLLFIIFVILLSITANATEITYNGKTWEQVSCPIDSTWTNNTTVTFQWADTYEYITTNKVDSANPICFVFRDGLCRVQGYETEHDSVAVRIIAAMGD